MAIAVAALTAPVAVLTAQLCRGRRVGSFEFDNSTNVVTLRTLGDTANATAALAGPGSDAASTTTLVGSIPGLGDYTLVFVRP